VKSEWKQHELRLPVKTVGDPNDDSALSR